MKKAYKEKSWQGLTLYTNDILANLNESSSYNCLLRHFVESINRTSALAPIYIIAAKEAGMKSPKKLLWKYVKFQIFGLTWGNLIDNKARHLQAAGVPILCQDVPAIHTP